MPRVEPTDQSPEEISAKLYRYDRIADKIDGGEN